MARSAELGRQRHVELRQGTVRFRERGEGPPVVFVHGLLVNGDLWRKVVPTVADAGFRCITPDLPLGSHDVPLAADADLTPPGVARLLADLLAALDLDEVTLVANDTGGGLTQILMANHPERIGRVVLTPSDSFEYFFPPLFRPLTPLARIPGAMALMATTLRIPTLRRLVFRSVARNPVADDVLASYVDPIRRDPRIRRDTVKFVRSVHRRYTLAAARKLTTFSRPVLLAWAPEDLLFPISLAHRLADALPDARVVEIGGARTFVPEDQPGALAAQVVEFARVEVTD